MANILAVDDDRDVCALLQTALARDGHIVQTLLSGTAVTLRHCQWADCILLDVMMPGEDGFATCRRIRAMTDAPILFLTAKAEEGDVLLGLGCGADDYLCKPFRLAELRARVNAHLRRQRRAGAAPAQNRLCRGGAVFDLGGKSLCVNGVPLHLTKGEYAICEYLALHPGQTFGKEQIYEAVFGFDGLANDSAVAEHIKNIRAKLRPLLGEAQPIETVWGIGYKWKSE